MTTQNKIDYLSVTIPLLKVSDIELLSENIASSLKKPLDLNNPNIFEDISSLLDVTGNYFFKATDPKIALSACSFSSPSLNDDIPFLYSGSTKIERTNFSSGFHQKLIPLAKLLNFEFFYNDDHISVINELSSCEEPKNSIVCQLFNLLGMSWNNITIMVKLVKDKGFNYCNVDTIPPGTPQMLFPYNNTYIAVSPAYHQGFLAKIHNTKHTGLTKDGKEEYSKWKKIKIGSNNPQNGGVLSACLGGWYSSFKSIPRVNDFSREQKYLLKVFKTGKLFMKKKLNSELLKILHESYRSMNNNVHTRNQEEYIFKLLIRNYLDIPCYIRNSSMNIAYDIDNLYLKYLTNELIDRNESIRLIEEAKIGFLKSINNFMLTQSNQDKLDTLIAEELGV